jgi:hypothetical protein
LDDGNGYSYEYRHGAKYRASYLKKKLVRDVIQADNKKGQIIPYWDVA